MNVNLNNRSQHQSNVFSLGMMAIFLAVWGLPGFSLGQPQRNCGTMSHLDEQIKSNPGIRSRMQSIEDDTQTQRKSAFHRVTGNITVPVVIYVIYRTPEENISDAQILSQLKVLNEDFQRKNADQIHTPSQFLARAANTGISFKLAATDPEGNPTNGIIRKKTNQFAFYSHNNGVKFSAMGGADPWPTTDYLNIWVCNLGMGVLGYAQFPGGPSITDGVVIGYKYFGTVGNGLVAPFNKGRTTTHEVGHWLNLRHIWGDGPCDVDDFVSDTPPADKPNHGCSSGHSACGEESMIQNFMDYTDDECMNLFTKGQGERMRALFSPGGYRRSLMYSPGLDQTIIEEEPIVQLPPEDLMVEDISASAALIKWSEVPFADGYVARFRRSGSSEWRARKFQNTEVRITQLSPCTDYEFQVESVFDKVGTGFSEMKIFSTTGCSAISVSDDEPIPLMRAPTGLYVTNIQGKEATINWSKVPGASSYTVQYKAAGSEDIISEDSNQPLLRLTNLNPGPIYLYRVRANFGDVIGPYSKTSFFIPAMFASSMRSNGDQDYIKVNQIPGQDALKVFYDIPGTGPLTISVFGPGEKHLHTYESRDIQRGSPFALKTAKLPQGRYELRFKDRQGFELAQTFEIRR